MFGVDMRDVISEAIMAHQRWKLTLNEAIETGTCKLSVEFVKSDRNCIFGKWLSTLDGLEPKSEYCKIKEMHLKFHICAARVLKLALEGKKNKAIKATGPKSRYSLYSTKLINMLSKLYEKVISV